MTDYLVGTGGWTYFPTENKRKLKSYAEAFNFVEVNYTFYEYPAPQKVQQWRRTVPKNFTFAVRCHQDLTHRISLKPVDEAYSVLGQMLIYCEILESPFLVLGTPSSYQLSPETVKQARDLLESIDFRGVRLVWENRAPLTPQAQNLMQDLNIVHSVDISRQMPISQSDLIYTRLFGKGNHNIYQFTDEELAEIDEKLLFSKPKTVALSYHGVRMYTDALRFISFKKTGKFPSITGYTGAESARTILTEDTQFPTSKQALIQNQGWKIFDVTAEKRLRLSDWLQRIPDKTYQNIDEVTDALENIR